MAKTKTKIPEGKLLKALAELEASIEKSDPLEAADPEGGFSTEGTPLSAAAPSGKSDTKKARGASSSSASSDDSSSDDASSSTAKAFSASDMMSSKDDASSKKKSKKTAKALPPPKDHDSSSDDASSDDDSDDSSSAEKSFREAAEQNETISKGIEVSDFLEALVDQVSLTMLKAVAGFQKSIVAMESRLNARIDSRVSKGIALSQDFNARLAKAVSAIGNDVQEQSDIVKSLSNQPVTQSRGKAVLSKGEVNQPPWGGAGGGGAMADGSDVDYSELASIPADKIGDWLFAKSTRNQIDPRLIMAWEADHYNVETLPAEIRKALANDLLK